MSLLYSSSAKAGSLPSECSVTAADSLLFYALLLQQVRTDTISAHAFHVVEQLQDCSDLLDKLKTQLQRLNQRLEQRRQSGGVSDDLRNYGRKLESTLQMAKGPRASSIDPAVMVTLSADGGAVRELLLAAASNCDPDPGGETRKLINEILATVETQNKSLGRYQKAQEQWQAEVSIINSQVDKLQRELDDAGIEIVNAAVPAARTSSVAPGRSAEAEKHLERVIEGLREIKAPSAARDALVKLLGAVATMIGASPSVHAASYVAARSTEFRDYLESGDSQPLVGLVSTVVNNHNYFVPGSFLQSLACVAICLPVWVSYQGDGDKQTRVQLIRSAVQFVHGIKGDKVDEIARALAGVSVGRAVT